MQIALPAAYLGTQLDRRYRLDRLIGEGASAWVFAARDLRLERDVAVKLLKPRPAAELPNQRERFIAEARTLARLVHAHIVSVHDAGETADGFAYLVMELSDAGNLEGELCRRGTLPVDETVNLLLPLMGALACAHQRGIVHRDVKPANIALVREGGETRTKLLDFGIAKGPDGGFSTDSARGTPSYMAPEQARGERVSPATDVWALGVVFYRCLSGQTPFAAATSLESLLKLVHQRPPRFAESCPGLAPHVAVALDRALEPKLARRYRTTRDLARALVIACMQDGVPLPDRPDPVGLPEFERWRAGADLERTGSLGPHEVAQPPLVGGDIATRPRPRRGSVFAGLLAVAVASAVTAWLIKPRETQVRDLRTRPLPALALEVEGETSAPARTDISVVPNLPAVALPPEQAARTAPRRPRTRRASVRIDPAQSAVEPTRASETSEPLAPLDAKQGFVKKWDW